MDFKILGPLQVLDGERPLAVGGARQRALLALLLLHVNEIVSSDRLLHELWGDEERGGSLKVLQVAVSRLRKVLEPQLASGQESRLLLTRPPGYELRLEHGRLDLQRFEEGVARGREALAAGDAAVAARHLEEALALWRGPALADLRDEVKNESTDDQKQSALCRRVRSTRGGRTNRVGRAQQQQLR